MATESETTPSSEKPSLISPLIVTATNYNDPQALGQTAKPSLDYVIDQARLYQRTAQDILDSTIEASRSRISQILSTSSAHFNQTLDSLEELKSEIGAYEDLVFEKIKEGMLVAASHPLVTGGVASGLGLLALKRPRRLLYHKTMRLFLTEESLLVRADAKVKDLRQSLDKIKAESSKLEKTATQAEDELRRGRTKLRQTGKQIQGVIRSAYKIERHAEGLKDILGELPRSEALQFRSKVSVLVSEAKRQRNVLTKEVTKISNYGISV